MTTHKFSALPRPKKLVAKASAEKLEAVQRKENEDKRNKMIENIAIVVSVVLFLTSLGYGFYKLKKG
jgi:hypothetical protein